jgi:uncharacterized membrane protein YhaH (DUF805 family)
MEKQESDYNLIDWWKKVLFKNYANFEGRARRAEYWNFVLCNIILVIPIYALMIASAVNQSESFSILGVVVLVIVAFGLLVPTLAVTVRRLHDLNKSGWYYFIGMIPLVGPIIMLVWYCTEGDRGTNNYGPDPKNPTIDFDFDQK